MSKTILLVATGRLVRKHIAYQNIEDIAKRGKCNCGRMLKAGEGNFCMTTKTWNEIGSESQGGW